MSEKIDDKSKVLPGDVIAEGDYLSGRSTYKEEGKIKSKVMGVARTKDSPIRVVPLYGGYIPEEQGGGKNEMVIGRVTGIGPSHWWVDINSPYDGYLSLAEGSEEFIDLDNTELSEVYDIGDIIYTEVIKVTKEKDVKLSMQDRMCKKLSGGRIVRISPSKVPRLIGKGGSMVEMIKDKTDSRITIGQNGIVWVSGGDEDLACKAVKYVDKRGHEKGLTEKAEKILEEE
ncbi:MAG: exosome complex RNA-binding protein Rrp4 [Candidatus Aenigmatarchaeota archaeon]